MGPVRVELMWQAALDALEECGPGPLDVVDLGGGTGGDAVRLAGLGHRVTVVDPSPDALASLERRSVEAGTSDRVRAALAGSDELADHLAAGTVDLVLCHGVLEHVEDPAAALAAVPGVLRAGGVVSVVVAGRHAAVVARAAAGDLGGAARLHGSSATTWDLRADGPRRFVVAEVDELLTSLGLTVVRHAGRRVVADLVPSSVVDGDPAARHALLDLERLLSASSEFTARSGGFQTLARIDSITSAHLGGDSAAV